MPAFKLFSMRIEKLYIYIGINEKQYYMNNILYVFKGKHKSLRKKYNFKPKINTFKHIFIENRKLRGRAPKWIHPRITS